MPSSTSLSLLQLKICASDEDPLDPISTEKICILCRPGLAPGKRSPCSCNIHFQIYLASSCRYVFPSSARTAWGTFHLVLNLFSVFRISRAGQILVLEFSKDGLADLGEKFTNCRTTVRPVILQLCVGFSCCQVSQCHCQFQSNF